MHKIWAVVPARSGSKGFPGKNIRNLAGVPLIGHAIRFAERAGSFGRILLTTDSAEYAEIGRSLGAWVPFLRGADAATDQSMEEHILADLDRQLDAHGIEKPDALAWLRPTFPFRRVEDMHRALDLLTHEVDSVRMVTEGEPRLYTMKDGLLHPLFDDKGRSMLRRQEFPEACRVYHTDIFWYKNIELGSAFLGNRVAGMKVHKVCSVDVDNADDYELAEAMIQSGSRFIRDYTSI